MHRFLVPLLWDSQMDPLDDLLLLVVETWRGLMQINLALGLQMPAQWLTTRFQVLNEALQSFLLHLEGNHLQPRITRPRWEALGASILIARRRTSCHWHFCGNVPQKIHKQNWENTLAWSFSWFIITCLHGYGVLILGALRMMKETASDSAEDLCELAEIYAEVGSSGACWTLCYYSSCYLYYF